MKTDIVPQLDQIDTDDVMPQPDQLKLIIVTCKTYLNCNLNLELIAKNLVLDDQIIGKKLLGIIEDGQIKKRTKSHKKTIKPGRKISRKDFSNQCTIIVQPPDSQKKLNLKIFGNGKIVITGGLSKEEGKYAVTVLKNKIQHLEDTYQIIPNSHFSDHFENIGTYLKYISKNYLIFLKFFSLYGINIDLRLDIILNKKLVGKYIDSDIKIADLVTHEIIKCDQPKDLEGYLRLIQTFNICHLYYPNDVFLKKLNQPNDFIHGIINRLYQFDRVTLPLTFDMDSFNRDFVVTVENYNTMFNCGFQNNREIFTQILNNKYKANGIIASAKFEPSNYQGINVKYVSRVLCHPTCKSTGSKKNTKCLCKEISFLIFQEGNMIITGGRHWEQLMDGYNVIVGIIREEYRHIVVAKTKKISYTETPTQITKAGPEGQKLIFLNKKKQIMENPRNLFLLKKFGLFDKYVNTNPHIITYAPMITSIILNPLIPEERPNLRNISILEQLGGILDHSKLSKYSLNKPIINIDMTSHCNGNKISLIIIGSIDNGQLYLEWIITMGSKSDSIKHITGSPCAGPDFYETGSLFGNLYDKIKSHLGKWVFDCTFEQYMGLDQRVDDLKQQCAVYSDNILCLADYQHVN